MIFLLACANPEIEDTAPPAYSCEAISGHICRFSGNRIQALGPDDILAVESSAYLPLDITFGPDGGGYFEDWRNHRLRRVDPDGTVTTIAGLAFIGDGPEGPAETASLNHPTHIEFGLDGNLYFAAWHNSRVDMIDMQTNMLSFIAGDGTRSFGGDGGPARTAKLDLPVSVAFDENGLLYISDQANWRIRTIDQDGIINTFAGTGEGGFSGDGGPASDAQFLSGSGQEATPGSRILIADNKLYLADTENHRIRVIDLETNIINTVAGSDQAETSGDGGPATQARLFGPTDVAMGLDGELYIADTQNSCIRVVTPDGIIDTFAGTCGVAGRGEEDGVPAAEATLNKPYGVSLDEAGNIYICDTYNNQIRVVYR
jgi:DNA-binding beta-propeller fold protein YncE